MGLAKLNHFGPSPRLDEGYDNLMDILADMRLQGVEVPPLLRSLAVQLLNEAKAAQADNERLISKHAHLQANHAQLASEFNSFCKNTSDGWRKKAEKTLCNDMRRSVDAANAASHESREEMKSMFTEHLVMANELAALRAETAQLRKENEALKEKKSLDMKN